MVKRLLCQCALLACSVIVAGFFYAVPPSLAAQHPRAVRVGLRDTGKTVPLAVGQQLIVRVPLQRRWDDNYWYVSSNSGAAIKLIAGPDTRPPPNWNFPSRHVFRPESPTSMTLWKGGSQVFYFQREAPGTVHLVLEQRYFSEPMVLKLVDAPALPALSPVSPLPPPAIAPAREKLIVRGVHFDFDQSRIRPGDAAVLDEDVSTLNANPNVTINVNGYCDATGSSEYNLKLSQRRADAVLDYLASRGIRESRLIPHGYGKSSFAATNDTAEGRAQNRRVELVPNE
jgi:outer membrane protein OmpA-like peptidoglycan-associated protein